MEINYNSEDGYKIYDKYYKSQYFRKFIKTGNLLFVGKHLPITTLHSNALIASQVLECIRGEEKKADQFYSKAKHWLFDKGPHINKSSINKLVTKL